MAVFKESQDGNMTQLKKLRCSNEETELQDLLEKNHDLLPGDQIEPEDPRRWLQIKREMAVPGPDTGTGRWSLDFLFVDQSAILTFVEAKRHNDTRARREVVGQIFDYTANAQFYWTADDLRRAAEETAEAKGGSLNELLQELLPDDEEVRDDPAAFFKLAELKLKEGNIRIIFFLDEAPRELKSLSDFLNSQMTHTEVLVVEAKQYTDGTQKIIVPRLFGYTEQARIVKAGGSSARNATAGNRKNWGEQSFFEDAQKKVPDRVSLLRKFYNALSGTADDITWGTGASNGSFSPKYNGICRRSPVTVYSDGRLQLQFGHLNGTETAEAFREDFFSSILAKGLGPLSDEQRDKFPKINDEDWLPRADELFQLIQSLVKKHSHTGE